MNLKFVPSLALGMAWLWAAAVPAQDSPPKPYPTFTRDILPIFQDHCQSCHRPGQIAPMSLLRYEDVRPWAKAIRKVVLERTMPPFPAAGPHGYFEGDMRLTEAEIETLSTWVTEGARRGDPKHAPAPVEWPSGGGQMTDPDLVIRFPSIASLEDNQDEWLLVLSEHVFPSNTWVEAIELISTDATLVHHAGVFAVGPKFFSPEGGVFRGDMLDLIRHGTHLNAKTNPMTENHLYTWLPGGGVERRPGGAFHINANERLALQVHIAPTPERRKSDLSIALRLAHGEYSTRLLSRALLETEFEIAPGDPHHELRREAVIHRDVLLRSVMFHLHERGKSAQINVTFPDGRTQNVLDIPRWDFNWQRTYHLATPLPLPAGTRIDAIGVWDNSAENPFNPDPTQTVRYGPRTTDEMYGASIFMTSERNAPVRYNRGHRIRRPLPENDSDG